jgi:ribosome-binding protein aMBF1 (putative translation factor)
MTESELNKIRIKIASSVREKREQLGISQVDLAEKTGLGIATIKRFESGKFWLNMKQYVIIRNALNLPN